MGAVNRARGRVPWTAAIRPRARHDERQYGAHGLARDRHLPGWGWRQIPQPWSATCWRSTACKPARDRHVGVPSMPSANTCSSTMVIAEKGPTWCAARPRRRRWRCRR